MENIQHHCMFVKEYELGISPRTCEHGPRNVAWLDGPIFFLTGFWKSCRRLSVQSVKDFGKL